MLIDSRIQDGRRLRRSAYHCELALAVYSNISWADSNVS